MTDVVNRILQVFAAFANAIVQRQVRQAFSPSDVGQCARDAITANVSEAATSVVVLSGPSGPSAILRMVAVRWVSAVQRLAFWASSHVANEHGEVIAPFIADRDAATSVEPVIAGGSDVAPRLHAAPDGVFARVGCDQGSAVLLAVAAGAIGSLRAPATRRVSAEQVFAELDGAHPALALTEPVGAFGGGGIRWRSTDDRQQPESLSGQVFRCCGWHANDYKASAPIVEAKGYA